jgi:hypothetical protein
MQIKISNKTYDAGKYAAQIALPALATFLATCLPLWDVSASMTNKIVTSVVAVNALLGSLILVSNAQYNRAAREDE